MPQDRLPDDPQEDAPIPDQNCMPIQTINTIVPLQFTKPTRVPVHV